MDKKTYTLNTLLTLVLGLLLLAAVLVRTFAPRVILPGLDVPMITAISLVVLLLDHCLAPNAKRCWWCVAGFSLVCFGLLPFAAGFVSPLQAMKLGLLGGAVFTAVTWLFGSMADRLSSGPAAKAAPFVSALGLYLAVQCLMGMF